MHIGIPKERSIHETRVAATPETVKQLLTLGFTVSVESNAGKLANISDKSYIQAGATITDYINIWKSDIILKVNAPEENEIILLNTGTILISFIWPEKNPKLIEQLADRQITVMSIDSVPRISRAQSLDALSSMANIVGYRAIIEAAYKFERFFIGQITAAGKILPAKVMVIGAGVAGLAAISTAKRLGAIVRAFDIRHEVKEQVQSMGAEFLELNIEKERKKNKFYDTTAISELLFHEEVKLFARQAREIDIIVTTVSIPNKPSPKFLTKEIVDSMKTGSVIVDIAAKNGGNCEYTVTNEIITTSKGVTVIGYTDLASRLPGQASQLYSNNLLNLLKILCKKKDGTVSIDLEDLLIRNITIVQNGKITYPVSSPILSSTQSSIIEKKIIVPKKNKKPIALWYKSILMILLIVLFSWLAECTSREFLDHCTIFILSCIIGYYAIWNVSYALHTVLMSVTNAISGIVIIAALLQINLGGFASFLSFISVLITSINIFGGFTVTHRMLKMFHKE